MTCSRCGADEWRRRKNGGRSSWECVPCHRRRDKKHSQNKKYHREWHLQRQYGISQEDYVSMLYEQDGRCAICQRKPTGKKRLHIDHDHATGDIRGLLCSNCNTGLGKFGDNVAVLQAAIRYLRQGA